MIDNRYGPMNTRERYRNDPAFKRLVDTMLYHIEQSHFTPSELRDAAVCAAILHESHNVQIIVSPLPDAIAKTLEALHKWEDSWLNERAGKSET